MRVEEIDARTAPDEVLARFAEVEHACWAETSSGEPERPVDEVIAFYRHQPTTHTSAHWLADGASGALYVHGPTAAFFRVLVVPDHRRRGLGSEILGHALETALLQDVRSLHAHHSTPAGAAFAVRHGFVDGQRVVRSVLALRDAALPEPHAPEGWELVTWLGRVPDEQLDAFVDVRKSMDDAPDPEGMDYPTITAEKVRESEESLARRGREMRVTVALRADGVIGSFTELRWSTGSKLSFTDDTGTAAEHRGLGLAKAVKAESLHRLRADHPEIEVVTTSNAEENAVMRHINASVGFVPKMVETTATLRL